MHPSNRLEAIHKILPDRFAIMGGLSICFPMAIYLKCASILINRYRKGILRGASAPWPFHFQHQRACAPWPFNFLLEKVLETLLARGLFESV